MKKDIKYIIWDFDNVLFRNDDNDYSDDYLDLYRLIDQSQLNKILSKNEPKIEYNPNNCNILITGRGEFQKDLVIVMLKMRKYSFNSYHFFHKFRNQYPNENPNISIEKYMEDYLRFKFGLISYYANLKNLIVIDDNEDIINWAKEKRINAKKVNILEEL